jgi:hypothetical protein
MTNTEVIDRLMKLVTENPSIVRLELGNKEVYKPKYDENRNLIEENVEVYSGSNHVVIRVGPDAKAQEVHDKLGELKDANKAREAELIHDSKGPNFFRALIATNKLKG